MTFHKYIGDSKMFEYDKYHHECKQQNKPFIKAKTNPLHKNYFIQIDMITCNYELTKNQQQDIQNLIQSEIDYVKSNSKHDFQGFNIDRELVWIDGVSSEHMGDFCNALYDLTQNNP